MARRPSRMERRKISKAPEGGRGWNEFVRRVPRFTVGIQSTPGWIRIETTKGRGRYDTAKQYGKPAKDV